MPKLGIGIVWWPELDPLCRPAEGLVQVIETEPETFWMPWANDAATYASPLAATLRHLPQPKLLHGVGAPFGGPAAQSATHRDTLAADIAALHPVWISDHLSFDRFEPDPGHPVFTGFFLPPAQSAAGVAQAAAHIRHRRDTAGVPVAFENAVSYLPPAPGEMTDGEFAAAVAEAADCGILLDLHNVLCNERNGRQSVRDFCNSIPPDRVWEIHVAGGASERGFWLDAHSGLVEPALMDIVAEIVPRLPSLGAITFEIVPEFVASTGLPAIAEMLGRLNDIWSTHATSSGGNGAQRHTSFCPAGIDPALWQHAIGAAVTGFRLPDVPPEFAAWISDSDAALALYRFLAEEGRASSLVTAVPRTIRLLLRTHGEMPIRALLAQFWRATGPAYTAIGEGLAFLDFVSSADLHTPGLVAEALADRASLEFMAG
jgi:uncharacterized protein (UPF0276 family)